MAALMTPINLQSNYPVLREQDAMWKQMLHDGVERFAAESLRLPAFGGDKSNRELAAEWLAMPLERTWICTSGHQGTMASLLAANLVGKTVAVEALTYPWFLRQAQMLGMRIVPIALDGECMQPEALREACLREPIAAIYTMPTLHNPTCAIASVARREAMVNVAREFDLTIIEDAAYSFLVLEPLPRYIDLAPERAFYAESLSKRVAPGLRTAFLAAPQALGEQVELALRVMTSGSSTLLASMGCAMAADGSLQRLIQTKQFHGSLRRRDALALLPELRIVAGPNTWHLWVTLPDGNAMDEEVERECEARGVLITGARWFTAPETPVPRAVRLGLGGETEWERVAEGLRIFADVVRG